MMRWAVCSLITIRLAYNPCRARNRDIQAGSCPKAESARKHFLAIVDLHRNKTIGNVDCYHVEIMPHERILYIHTTI